MRPKYSNIIFLSNDMDHNPTRRLIWKPNLDARMRMTAATCLYHAFDADTICVTGGKMDGEDNPPLSHVLRTWLVAKHHIPFERIIVEDESIDTTGNAENLLPILERKGISPEDSLLVTNEYHLDRALDSFRKMGLDVAYGYPAEYVLDHFGSLTLAKPTTARRLRRFTGAYRASEETRAKVRANKLARGILHVPFIGAKATRALAARALRQKLAHQ